jgi:hypothetical protein
MKYLELLMILMILFFSSPKLNWKPTIAPIKKEILRIVAHLYLCSYHQKLDPKLFQNNHKISSKWWVKPDYKIK